LQAKCATHATLPPTGLVPLEAMIGCNGRTLRRPRATRFAPTMATIEHRVHTSDQRKATIESSHSKVQLGKLPYKMSRKTFPEFRESLKSEENRASMASCY
jgi:hypothetical protein